MNHFFAYLYRMKYITRWSLMKNTVPENLKEHSLDVAMVAHCLAVIRRDVYKKDCNPDRIAVEALYHDAAETMTGDLPTPIKYMTPQIRDAYRSIEREAEARILAMLPAELQDSYKPILSPADSEDQILLKAADRICAYIKCRQELKGGNDEYRRAAEQTKLALDEMCLPEVTYFFTHFIPSFEMSIDEMDENFARTHRKNQ